MPKSKRVRAGTYVLALAAAFVSRFVLRRSKSESSGSFALVLP